MRAIRVASFLFAAAVPVAAMAQPVPAGTITLLNGQASAAASGSTSHALAKGDTVYDGDTVETGAGSYTLIKFTDDGTVLLRPNSRFQVERYRYGVAAPAPAAAPTPAAPQTRPLANPAAVAGGGQSAFFRLLKGGLRAVSGLIAHADYANYRMSTPVATMGIRGTDYEIVVCDEACQTDPSVLKALPPGESPAGAVVSGVNSGEITVTSITGSSVTLDAGQYAITLADGSQYLLGGLPAFLAAQSAAASTVTSGAAGAGVAAGGVPAASAVAGGSLLVGAGVTAGVGALIGVVVGTSSNNTGSTTTATTSTGASH
ncbi:MAG: hypothetical protein P4L83_02570 [Nevskia sp.]|nr:hypothetical protein [Nevskia sp.]